MSETGDFLLKKLAEKLRLDKERREIEPPEHIGKWRVRLSSGNIMVYTGTLKQVMSFTITNGADILYWVNRDE